MEKKSFPFQRPQNRNSDLTCLLKAATRWVPQAGLFAPRVVVSWQCGQESPAKQDAALHGSRDDRRHHQAFFSSAGGGAWISGTG